VEANRIKLHGKNVPNSSDKKVVLKKDQTNRFLHLVSHSQVASWLKKQIFLKFRAQAQQNFTPPKFHFILGLLGGMYNPQLLCNGEETLGLVECLKNAFIIKSKV
jgi:hypothetical protein